VCPRSTFKGRFDEITKCMASPPFGATLRAFYADGVITVKGLDLSKWMRHVGKPAPSEQGMAHLVWFNVEAAWRGETRTLTLAEAKADLATHGGEWELDSWKPGPQPTPGVFVWRHHTVADWQDLTRTAESAAYHLQSFINLEPPLPPQAVIGNLLDAKGALLRFMSPRPLTTDTSDSILPRACITVLGGPKGIPDDLKGLLHGAFSQHGAKLLEVSFGPYEHMAHVCVSFVRVQDDAGLYRAALTDLLRLGPVAYRELLASAEARLHGKGFLKPASTPAPISGRRLALKRPAAAQNSRSVALKAAVLKKRLSARGTR